MELGHRQARLLRERAESGKYQAMAHGNGGRAESETVKRSTTQARQGVTGHNVRYVLAAGVAAVVVLFAIVYIIYFN
jgi:hypothetical protein